KARVDSMGPATLSDTQQSADAMIAHGVEASLAALGGEKQRDLVSSLLVGVARSCDGAAEARGAEIAKRLSAFVADPDREVGETAALSIGILRHPAGLADLAGLLHDDDAGRKLAGGRVPTRTR